MMAPGVHVSFFDEGGRPDSELPPIGPLIGVVVRRQQLVVERMEVEPPSEPGPGVVHWLEAQIELQRATGEAGDRPHRSSFYLVAPDGVYLRFTDFDDSAVAASRELGPFAVVLVGERSVEADGTALATRAARASEWEIAAHAGAGVGPHPADIAFRTTTTPYHSRIRLGLFPAASVPARPPLGSSASAESRSDLVPVEGAPVEGDTPQTARAEGVERAEPTAPAARIGAFEAPAVTLRSRIGTLPDGRVERRLDERRRSGPDLRSTLWRVRFVIVGLLVAGFGVYGVTTLGRIGAGDAQSDTERTLAIGQKASGPRWDYVVDGVSRDQVAGRVNPRGVFLVVRVSLTNRGGEGAQASPTDFVVVDANGTRYGAEPLESGVYSRPDNPTSYPWPTSFPGGRRVTTRILFDIDPAATGLVLVMAEAPKTKIRLQ